MFARLAASQQTSTTPLSATIDTTALQYIHVWCLLIDHDHKPTFGEPFPIFLHHSSAVHELKAKICRKPDSQESRPNLKVDGNRVEIWRCKSLKLFAKDSFDLTKKQLRNFKFSDEEDSDVQHLGPAQRVNELELEDSEILLAVVP